MDIDDFKEKFPNELVPSPEEFIAATNVIMEARRNIGFDKDGWVKDAQAAYELAAEILESKKVSQLEK